MLLHDSRSAVDGGKGTKEQFSKLGKEKKTMTAVKKYFANLLAK
jgi:hypothetical protein